MNIKLSSIVLEPTRPDVSAHVEVMNEHRLVAVLGDLAASFTNEYTDKPAARRRTVAVLLEYVPDALGDGRDELTRDEPAEVREFSELRKAFAAACNGAPTLRTIGD